jgi:hypothetical protein
MATGYEHLSDEKFWAEVRELLELIQRDSRPAAPLTAWTDALADYVITEAETRDPVLAANRRQRRAMTGEAGEREGISPADLVTTGFTAAENARYDTLAAAYRRRLVSFAKAGGDPARRTEIRITRVRGRTRAMLRGNTYRGRDAGTIARRLFGRSAVAVPFPDPASKGQGMITRTGQHGTHVLADYTEH